MTSLTVKNSLKQIIPEDRIAVQKPKDESPLKFAVSLGLYWIVDILLNEKAKIDS